jgi:hypothetical protein
MFYYITKMKLTVAQPGIINAQVGRCIYQPRRNEGYMIQVGSGQRAEERERGRVGGWEGVYSNDNYTYFQCSMCFAATGCVVTRGDVW